MITYVVSVFAKPGHELAVTKFYQDLEPLMREATGFKGRKILRARPGTMEAEVRRVTPPEQLKGHAHEGDAHDGPAGVHFVLVEQWDSVADRVAFSQGASKARSKDLFPHLLPAHSHEFYEDVTPQS
ncbi:MAG: hypothetical protein ABI661_12390 [Gammaproteobacteria bacterium]